MASIKSAIRNAINKSQERYIVKSVHLSKMEDPQMLGGAHTVWVELSVAPRKRKKSAGAYKPFPDGLYK